MISKIGDFSISLIVLQKIDENVNGMKHCPAVSLMKNKYKKKTVFIFFPK